MNNITFEQLPQAVSFLIERVEQLANRVEEMLGKSGFQQGMQHRLLTLEETAALLDKSVYTIYSMTSEKRIPYHKKGNKLYFFEDEIIGWIKQGGTTGTGNDDDFNKRLEELRAGKRRKPRPLLEQRDSRPQ